MHICNTMGWVIDTRETLSLEAKDRVRVLQCSVQGMAGVIDSTE